MGHNHDHQHDHGHGHCHHGDVRENNLWRVGLAAILTGLFMAAEIAGGLISGSLALLADAGHMMTDFAALAMAWGAFTLARRPANWKHTFGYDRVSILVAFVNGLVLFVIAGWIMIEAAQRLANPGPILAGPMLWVALAGLVINLIVFRILLGADQENLNVRGAVLHVMGDLLGSIAAIAAALIIMKTGWLPIDPILSVIVALLILRSAWALIKDSAYILLEGAPRGFDRRLVSEDLAAHIENLISVDQIYAWSITQSRHMVTLEGTVEVGSNLKRVSKAIKARLRGRYGIENAIVDLGPIKTAKAQTQ